MTQHKLPPLARITARRLEEIREAKGLSEGQFAREIRITRQTYGHWRKGRNVPGGESLVEIATKFHVTPGWILGIPGEPMYRAQSREAAALHNDVAAAIASDIARRAHGQPWARELSHMLVDGRAVLDNAVDREVSELTRAWKAGETYARGAKKAVESALALLSSWGLLVNDEKAKPAEQRLIKKLRPALLDSWLDSQARYALSRDFKSNVLLNAIRTHPAKTKGGIDIGGIEQVPPPFRALGPTNNEDHNVKA